MIRLTCLFALLPGMALAHLGHVGELAGHDHWGAGAAIGAAVLAGLWGAWKGKDQKPAPEESADEEAAA